MSNEMKDWINDTIAENKLYEGSSVMRMDKRGWVFGIFPEEAEKIIAWQEKHVKEIHYPKGVVARFSYEFTPTPLGDIAVVKCNCGEEFCFRDID